MARVFMGNQLPLSYLIIICLFDQLCVAPHQADSRISPWLHAPSYVFGVTSIWLPELGVGYEDDQAN